MELYSQDTLAARRRHRRRTHTRRRAVATTLLGLLLAVAALVAIPRGSGAAYAPAADWFVHRERVFPKPDRLARLPYVAVAGRRHREVALTFDDGPGPYTAEVVRTLRRLRAPGTFFQVGATEHYFTDAEELQRTEPLVTVGVHTLGHRRLDRLGRADQAAEIDRDSAILTAAGNPRPTLFRPPYGAY